MIVRRVKRLSTALVAGFLSVAPAGAAIYYVSNSGSDSNNGTSDAAAWKTLQKAADSVAAGDTVRVRAGTYAGFGYGGAGGTQGSPITFAADTGVLVNSAAPGGVNPGLNAINIEPASGKTGWVIISGFKITGGYDKAGIRLVACDNCQVLNNDVANTGGTWGMITSFSDNLLVQGNVCHDSGGQHGIYMSDGEHNAVVRGNILYGNNWDGLHMNTTNPDVNDGAIVEDNISHDNNLSGMDIEGVTNAVFRNNIIYNNTKHGITLHSQDQANTPACANNIIANNTIVGNGMFGVEIQAPDMAETLYDNIFLNSSSTYGSIGTDGTSSSFRSDYNVVVDNFSTTLGNSRLTLAQWQGATGQDLHSLVAAASELFVNAPSNDYHLKADAPAIDRGISYAGLPALDFDGHYRVQGAAVDAGAYEFGSGAPSNSGGNSGEPPVPGKHVFWPTRGEDAIVSCGASAQVFDREGRDVADLASDGAAVRWNGRDSSGTVEAAGAYLIRCGGQRSRIVLLK